MCSLRLDFLLLWYEQSKQYQSCPSLFILLCISASRSTNNKVFMVYADNVWTRASSKCLWFWKSCCSFHRGSLSGLRVGPQRVHTNVIFCQCDRSNRHSTTCFHPWTFWRCHIRCPFYYFTSPIFWTFTWSSSRTNILHELVDTNYINRTVFASWIQWCKNIS